MKCITMRVGMALATIAAAGVLGAPARASLVTSDPGTGTTITFTATGNNGFGNPGPVVVDGVTVTGNPQVTYGDAHYVLVANGSWDMSWVATNNGSGTINFDLGGLYGLAGGFVNYAPNNGSPPTITALGADGTTVLETYDLAALAPISTPGSSNDGAFRGISRATSDIAFLQLGGSYILSHTLVVGDTATPDTNPVPE